MELLLVDVHIHFLDEKAVGGDAVTLVEKDDVANDEIFAIDSLGGAILTAQNSDFLVHDLGLEAQELLFFAPVAESLDCGGEEDGKVDGDGLEPLLGVGIFRFGKDTDNEGDGGEDEEDNDVLLVELVLEDLPE
jgi:hypothetical protein